MGNYSKDKKYYCQKCGLELIHKSKFSGEYDVWDGEKIIWKWLECPKKRWWNNHSDIDIIREKIEY